MFFSYTLCAMLFALCVQLLLVDDRIQSSQIQIFLKVTLLGGSIPASDDAGAAPLTQ
jgi:hypothetical protein